MAKSSGGDSYYSVIRGKKYDRRMLELAEGLTRGKGDGRISISDAKNLLRVVKDANNYSAIEKQTMEYIRRHYKFTKEGDEFFRSEIRRWAASKPRSKKAKAASVEPVATEAPMAATTPAPVAKPIQTKKRSAFGSIVLALLAIIALAVLFYLLAYKMQCARPNEPTPAPVTENRGPDQKAAPVVENTAAAAVSDDVRTFVESQKLPFRAEEVTLAPAASAALDALAEKLKAGQFRIRITGHTCSLGPHKLNEEISLKRAQIVRDALVSRGVSADRIEVRGIADAEPAGDNRTVAGRVASRRVTFNVVK